MGVYFSWGNIDGHQGGDGYDFSQEIYDTTPGASIDTDLSLLHDAARANLGAPWRMPSTAEFQELVANCNSVWTTLNGVGGRLFTSNVNGETLFLPATGLINGVSLNYRGVRGYYWSSSYYSDTNASDMYFSGSSVGPLNNSERRTGFSVRAVRDP